MYILNLIHNERTRNKQDPPLPSKISQNISFPLPKIGKKGGNRHPSTFLGKV